MHDENIIYLYTLVHQLTGNLIRMIHFYGCSHLAKIIATMQWSWLSEVTGGLKRRRQILFV